MSLLVTGTPGSGKTALVAYAGQIGDKRFVDADEIPGLCEWREFNTGKVVGLVGEVTVTGGDAWYKKHGWYWRIDQLQQFLADSPVTIVCGSSENIADCYKFFDHITILRKTEAELLQNLQSPDRVNPFGKTPEQRTGFMKWQDYLIKEAQAYPVSFIDSNVIDEAYSKIVPKE